MVFQNSMTNAYSLDRRIVEADYELLVDEVEGDGGEREPSPSNHSG